MARLLISYYNKKYPEAKGSELSEALGIKKYIIDNIRQELRKKPPIKITDKENDYIKNYVKIFPLNY
ncbi:MAG: hypothetical protein ACRYGR_05475 [Janthinobacterium lividum]